VIVTDGETRPALAATRSLSRAGVAVEVWSSRPPSLAGRSRAAAAEVCAPDPARAPEAFAERLSRRVACGDVALVLPVTEVTLGTCYAQGLDELLLLAAPPRDAYALAVDKWAILERGAKWGLDIPRTEFVEQIDALRELPSGFSFPVVLKARRSRWLEAGRWHRGGVHLVRDGAELAEVRSSPDLAAGALLQELVPGHGEGMFLLMDRGTPQAAFAHRRLREKPPTGGVSVLCEAIEPDPALRAGSEGLLGELRWHGVAMVEFRRTPDGRAALMEVNPRLWGSLQLAIDAGVDFPRLLLALYRGECLPQASARVGARTRWLLGDLDHLILTLRDPEMRRATGRGAGGAVMAFLASFFDGSRDDTWRWLDPGPFFLELRQWIAGVLARGSPAAETR
jgi:predicted ATP-grasp superfamily ATP-dependent carboligase